MLFVAKTNHQKPSRGWKKQMSLNNVVRSLMAAAVVSALCGNLAAKELVIPTMPSAAQKKAEVVPQPSAPVNPADFGLIEELVEAETPPPKVLTSKAAEHRSAQVKPPMSEMSDTDVLQVSGGGRDGDLPMVPSSVAKTSAMETSVMPEEPVSSYQEIVVIPGVNTIIPAAVNHLNRIVTPFDNPIVQTVSSAQIKVKENVIYVSTESESPVTMYITPKDDETVAISLTLAPRKVPPIQANLILGDALSAAAGTTPAARRGSFGRYSGQAKKWEESQPYMDSIKGIMRALAFGQIPKGYSIGKAGRQDSVPACYQGGINFDFTAAQVVMGHNFKVLVGVARNQSNAPVMFDETSCTHPTLAATAVWPRNMLEPGDATEVYVVTRVGESRAEESTRPSLLN
jgi:conjugal transfer pilus assembly protein TraK